MADWGEVRRVVERPELNADGELVTVVVISAVTARGTPFTLSVPADEYEPELANERLAARAIKLDALYLM